MGPGARGDPAESAT
ncbi:hypothetical protein TIFTF001_055495 [Ficus carica]|uniref:Uncharacterized protein n=1 Tax=Ficus carica TaxID=3494 RepID=A0AA88JEL3_FICCA|nr:hypothetical protein TIFTF001_055492 [Ficus carica]GMN70997.1 hypothetical protein TIFTF001_055495 [Ficus carica]